jgi:hypothetical protein
VTASGSHRHSMAELVVYGLEVVDVDHHHAQRRM